MPALILRPLVMAAIDMQQHPRQRTTLSYLGKERTLNPSPTANAAQLLPATA